MASRLLPGTDVRVRRGRRRDLPRLRAMLGQEESARHTRLWRRVLADLGADVYVAEDAAGEIVGMVSVVYVRSIMQGGIAATLDGARACRPPARKLLDGLVAFAEARAARRGCRRLAAWIRPEEAELRAALLARGWRSEAGLVTELGSAA